MPSLQGGFSNGLPVVLLSTNYSDPLLLLVDTGSAVLLITDRVLCPDADIQSIRIHVEAVTRDQIPIIGTVIRSCINMTEMSEILIFWLQPSPWINLMAYWL